MNFNANPNSFVVRFGLDPEQFKPYLDVPTIEEALGLCPFGSSARRCSGDDKRPSPNGVAGMAFVAPVKFMEIVTRFFRNPTKPHSSLEGPFFLKTSKKERRRSFS